MEPLIRDITDTARWVAVYRARESERPDAVFKDPFARALALERGEQIAHAVSFADEFQWSFVARTYAFDRFITRLVASGVDTIVNLAAGLDTRPYRLPLPPSLQWFEVDLPEMLEHKASVLASDTPACVLERVPVDLSNEDARRGAFARIARASTRAAVITEGLLLYLMPRDVLALGRDLAAVRPFQHWVVDLISPGLLDMLNERMGEIVRQAGAPYLFAPSEGPAFFERSGWTVQEVRSMLKTARKLGRLPLKMRMIAMLPESNGPQGDRPWSGVCLLAKR